MKLQFAMDTLTTEAALELAAAAAPSVDIIELGTPLIKAEGFRAITAIKEAHPDKIVFADLKTMDAGELEAGEAIERELALLKVNAPADRRGELLALAEVFSARVADLGPNAIIFEIVGSPEELDSFEELVRPHGLKELARTGRIGLARASTARAPKRQHVLR